MIPHPPAPIETPTPALRVGFILARRFTLSAFANFVDVLRLAADEGDRSRPIHCSWRVLSANGGPVTSSCGVVVEPDERLADPRRFDYIVVIGGLIPAIERLEAVDVAYLRRAAAVGVPLIGICTGAFILHRAGLMDGYRCCVSWFHHDDFLEQFDGLTPVSDQIFVVDRDRLTCSGGASSAHLAAFLVDRHIGAAAARKSLNIMIIDGPKPGDNPQPGLPLDVRPKDPLVQKALHLMRQNVSMPLPVARLADRLNVSRRKLERHFAGALGRSPAEAGMSIRLHAARHQLETTDLPVTEIAAATGFCDASHLGKAFQAAQGETPLAYRRRLLASARAERASPPDEKRWSPAGSGASLTKTCAGRRQVGTR